MHSVFNNLKETFRFIKKAPKYLQNVLLANGFILLIVIPILVSSSRLLLKNGNIPYLSYDTVVPIFLYHPFVFIGLLLMLFLFILILYWEYTFLLLTVYHIQHHHPIRLRQLIRETISKIRGLHIRDFTFFLGYFILFSPLGLIQFHSDLLSKIRIPVFILDFIFEFRVQFVILVIAFYLFVFYVAIRLILVLPLIILRGDSLNKAVKSSIQYTRKNFLLIIIQFLTVIIPIAIMIAVLNQSIIFLQRLFDTYFVSYSLAAAIFFLTFLQLTWLFNLILTTVGMFFVTVTFLDKNNIIVYNAPETSLEFSKSASKRWFLIRNIMFGIGIIWLMWTIIAYNIEFLNGIDTRVVTTLSHRGVDGKNGVQNTTGSLIKTSQDTQPNFIEMDIQQTKDGQFVVFHDFDLKALTGLEGKPYQYTLDELQKMTVKENNQTHPITSFDDYLLEAKRLEQKLLIEIKATRQDSPDMIDQFIDQYGEIILQEGYQIHSLSFDVVSELKDKEPRFTVGYIMPFVLLGPPEGNLDFYSIEYTTLTPALIESIHKIDKKIYVWTPNDTNTMNRMIYYGVDGIITDEMSVLNEVLLKNKLPVTYSDKLIYFLIGRG